MFSLESLVSSMLNIDTMHSRTATEVLQQLIELSVHEIHIHFGNTLLLEVLLVLLVFRTGNII